MTLQLSLAVCDYDRTRAIFDGRAKIEGCDVTAVALEPEESFHRAFKFNEFDISEISMSSYMMTAARGEAHYVAIPAFVSRLFRHSGIYIRTDRGITGPHDLKGRPVGLPEYQMTANVWIRGIFEDEYGVKPSDIRWRRGGLEEPGREERTKIKLPAVEEVYFRKTRIFPIMHAVGIRRSLVERHPWLAVSVYKAFLKAKALCMKELGQIGHLATSLPWSVAEYDRLRTTMGEDYWSYGVAANRHVLETLTRYSFAQGLSVRKLEVDEMFAPSTYELSKV